MIDCLLVVVSYRSGPDLQGLLPTIPGSVGDLSWHTIVVNNDSTEDLSAVVAGHPHVELVDAGANLGYAGGINAGLAAARPSRWTVFLNPDVRLGQGALAAMAQAAGERDAVVPTIVSDAGVVQHSLRREPSVLGSLGDAVFGNRWKRRPPPLGEMIRDEADYASPRTVDWATGAALLVPTPVVQEVGPWDDDRFFLYSEETDYCRRLRAAGSRIRYLPAARVVHRGAGSGSSDTLHALLEVNRVRYFRKWHRAPATAAFAGVTVLNNLLRSHRPRSRAALRALLRPADRATLPGGPR